MVIIAIGMMVFCVCQRYNKTNKRSGKGRYAKVAMNGDTTDDERVIIKS